MGIPGSANLLLAAAEAESYQLERSLRFNSNDGAYLWKSDQASDETWCYSFWIKACDQYSEQYLWLSRGTNCGMWIRGGFSGDPVSLGTVWNDTSIDTNKATVDPAAWYHIFVKSVETTTSYADINVYVNGVLWQTRSNQLRPYFSYASQGNAIGRYGNIDGFYFDGYMAEVHFIDETAYDPTDFGEFDNNGVWRPIEVTGLTYGTRGFYLNFDPDAANGVGHDHSGNGNHYTAYNFITSGGGTDVMSDTPTTNWCTLNPLEPLTGGTMSEGNLQWASPTSTPYGPAFGTIGMTEGKYYWEVTPTSLSGNANIGIIRTALANNYLYNNPTGYAYRNDGQKGNNSTVASYGSSYSAGDIIGVAYDATNGTLAFYKNGASQGNAYTGLSGLYFPGVDDESSNNTSTFVVNFGQREFAFPPGTYSAGDYFNTVTYNGNGGTKSVTGVGFQPDLVWIKYRDAVSAHGLFDSVRGAGKSIRSDDDSAEQTQTDSLTSFDSDGFSLGDNSEAGPDVNYRTGSYVAWCWKAGDSTSSNTDGTITSTVSANQTAGFSIVTYTGNGSTGQSIGHGLGVAPKVCIIKPRSSNQTYPSWWVRHESMTSNHNARLDLNAISSNTQTEFYQGGIANLTSSTVVSFNTGSQSSVDNVNRNGSTYVAYCFAEKTGISKFSSYTGNGSVDGPEINDLGFAPALLVIKRTDAVSEWAVYDSARGNDNQLRWDQTDAQNTNSAVNVRLTSNGFKIATSDAAQNASGGTYIYMAWARDFTVDGDYKALNTKNLPAPDIKDGSNYFNTLLYTGDGTAPRSLTGVGFQPDWVWIKARDQAWWHVLGDSVRGSNGTNGLNLNTNDTAFEGDENSGHVESWDSDGFTVEQADSGANPLVNVNNNGSPYVAWNWKAGGTASSNTAGTITSTVSANPSAGFSIVSYTGNATSGATIGHGLGVAPSWVIVKNRDSGTQPWRVYHSSLGATKALRFDIDTVQETDTAYWNNTAPSSTVITLGNDNSTNANGDKYIAYCFAEVEGYSKISEFTGNGSTDGSFVYCGFKPSWILLRRYAASRNWYLYDAARNTFNVVGTNLFPDLPNAEGTADALDIVSNGFKMRTTNTSTNGSGDKILFVAFASNPFGGSGVSPATAR